MRSPGRPLRRPNRVRVVLDASLCDEVMQAHYEHGVRRRRMERIADWVFHIFSMIGCGVVSALILEAVVTAWKWLFN